MLVRETVIPIDDINEQLLLEVNGKKDLYKKSIYLDLEHYVYRIPICVGVFGIGYLDEEDKVFRVVQYMLENREDVREVLYKGKELLRKLKTTYGKSYITTFSGNNDFTVIRYLFKKYKIDMDVNKEFISIDIQEEYKKVKNEVIGLKNLEKIFNIDRDGEVISGNTLAKTIGKMFHDREYCYRIPREKIDKILVYNEKDVYNLFLINILWNKFIND
ncbi:ribonuclease H-like domain-containing protein [Clostridium bornimense]|uniref:ribonuclease H-like domain-containing protein n=1 Tax=Clostridium bornimense TaxID=1216932 RepID=UPI001C121327|nr:ribonuclease H-like domain-containing protein [Clostridium bornimense]MBU5315021.1 ribonuclease H-like domain-containing protein [Clostridium bornimense]